MSTSEWLDPEFAARWTAADTLKALLDLPRRLAAAVVAADRPDPALVVDIGSGPGDFLAVLLDAFPRARGLWSDVSPPMAATARETLAGYGGRVDYRLADMRDPAGLPSGVDVIVTSRSSHHLDPAGLADFYVVAAAHLAPGGWLANLDHVGLTGPWNGRLRGARKALVPRPASASGHRHPNPLPTVADHLGGLRAAGLTDLDTPWRAFYTCLFMARRG